MTPSYFVILLKGDLLQIPSGLEVVIVFGFTEFVGLSCVGALFYHDWFLFISPNLDGWVS